MNIASNPQKKWNRAPVVGDGKVSPDNLELHKSLKAGTREFVAIQTTPRFSSQVMYVKGVG